MARCAPRRGENCQPGRRETDQSDQWVLLFSTHRRPQAVQPGTRCHAGPGSASDAASAPDSAASDARQVRAQRRSSSRPLDVSGRSSPAQGRHFALVAYAPAIPFTATCMGRRVWARRSRDVPGCRGPQKGAFQCWSCRHATLSSPAGSSPKLQLHDRVVARSRGEGVDRAGELTLPGERASGGVASRSTFTCDDHYAVAQIAVVVMDQLLVVATSSLAWLRMFPTLVGSGRRR